MILTSGLSLLFACSVLVLNDVLQVRESLVKQLTDQAGLVGDNSSAALVFHDSQGAQEILDAFRHQPAILQALLYLKDGNVLAQYQPGPTPDYSSFHRRFTSHVTWKSVKIFRPIFSNHEYVGGIYLESSLQPVYTRLGSLLTITLTAMLLSSLLAIIISSRLQKTILSPLGTLTEVADHVSRNKDYSLRAPGEGTDEIGTLIKGFNTMLQEIQEQNKELNRHRSHLSGMVTERTAELSETNSRLQDEIVKRERIAQQVLDMADDLKMKNEELALSRDQALQAARAKAEFLATMSHEIRTPMNGILGMTDLLLGTELTPNQVSLAHTVQTSAEALLTLLNDILDFSKIEAGKLELESIDFDLRATLEASLDVLAERAASKHLELTGLIFPDVPTSLRGDPGRLRQVILNLLGNAIKFTDTGEVNIQVLLGIETHENVELRFHIWDTGIGIRPEVKQKLFQVFSQADSSTTRKFGGTGLGLAICQQLVELMGGEIGVESQPNAWTLFWFSIKVRKAPSPLQQEWIPRKDLQGLRLCCIDDNATNLYLIQNYAQSWGIETYTTTCPTTGLAALREAAQEGNPFDVAIIDRTFPEQDGIQFGQRVKHDATITQTKLMLLTSVAQRGEALDAQQAGFDAYLTKPIHRMEFHDSLATMMGFATSNTQSSPKPLITRHTVKEAQSQSRTKILVADDHAVNQQLMNLLLEKLGFASDVVSNGQEAIMAVSTGSYSLVLMDCQMPEMDGFEATKKIREEEKGKGTGLGKTDGLIETNSPDASPLTSAGSGRLPIIALTANAMPGDREKCLAAGMDDYLSKPVRPEELAAMLDHWLPSQILHHHTLPTSSIPEPPHRVSDESGESDRQLVPPIDSHRLQEWRELGGPEFVKQMGEQFVRDVTACVEAIERALETQNEEALAEAAHGLKGISANIGATHLQQLALDLERTARTSQPLEGPETIAALRTTVNQVTTFLASALLPEA